jgi:hypothetical protein
MSKEMKPPKVNHQVSIGVTHIHYDICSISIARTDEGIVVDIWEPQFEGAEPVATTWALETELRNEEEPDGTD